MPRTYRVTTELPATLHRKLKAGARRHGSSLGGYIRDLLREIVSGSDPGASRRRQSGRTEESEPWKDPVVEELKKGVDLDALRRNLRLTPAERIRALGEEMDRRRAEEAASGAPKTTEAPVAWFGVQAQIAAAMARSGEVPTNAGAVRVSKKRVPDARLL